MSPTPCWPRCPRRSGLSPCPTVTRPARHGSRTFQLCAIIDRQRAICHRAHGQPHREAGAPAYRTRHSNSAAMQLGQQLYHRQTEARAPELSGEATVHLAERLKEPRQPLTSHTVPLSVTLISRNSENPLSASATLRPCHAPEGAPTTARGTRQALSITSPPSLVNFTAFESML